MSAQSKPRGVSAFTTQVTFIVVGIALIGSSVVLLFMERPGDCWPLLMAGAVFLLLSSPKHQGVALLVLAMLKGAMAGAASELNAHQKQRLDDKRSTKRHG